VQHEDLVKTAEAVLKTHTRTGGFASVSLIQRHLKIGYNTALRIMERLQFEGAVTSPDAVGKRYLRESLEGFMQTRFEIDALEKFSGCDGDAMQAGTPESPSIWVLGIEHGTFQSRHEQGGDSEGDDTYSIETQMAFPFNRRLFALLAALEGERVESWKDFASRKQPFVRGAPGYFKGNLYPVACSKIAAWTQEAIGVTGFSQKAQYVEWCERMRLPVLRRWVTEHRPKLVIGLGVGYRDHFEKAILGSEAQLQKSQFFPAKNAYFGETDGLRLVVLPHFSGRNGLNSNASIAAAAKFIDQAFPHLNLQPASKSERELLGSSWSAMRIAPH